MGFLKLQEQIPSISKIFGGEDIIPTDIGLKYALISALVSHAADAKQFDRLLNYALAPKMPREFSVLLAKLLISKNQKMTTSQPTYFKWAKTNQDVLLTKK
jgi:hypothetical protein